MYVYMHLVEEVVCFTSGGHRVMSWGQGSSRGVREREDDVPIFCGGVVVVPRTL